MVESESFHFQLSWFVASRNDSRSIPDFTGPGLHCEQVMRFGPRPFALACGHSAENGFRCHRLVLAKEKDKSQASAIPPKKSSYRNGLALEA